METFLRQIGIDCNITLEKPRFSASRLAMSRIPGFILRHIFELLNFSHLLSFHLFDTSATIWAEKRLNTISFFSYRLFLIRLNFSILETLHNFTVGLLLATLSSRSPMLSRIVLGSAEISTDILKKSLVPFK